MIYVLENYSHTSQHWHIGLALNEEDEELLTGGEKGGEGGRAEDSSATGDSRQAAISHMPNVDGAGSGSLLDSILSTLLKN